MMIVDGAGVDVGATGAGDRVCGTANVYDRTRRPVVQDHATGGGTGVIRAVVAGIGLVAGNVAALPAVRPGVVRHAVWPGDRPATTPPGRAIWRVLAGVDW